MYDVITDIGNSVIQHGKYNDRIYLMKLSKTEFPEIIEKLDILASEKGYSKIFAKLPLHTKDTFIKNGYVIEASIPAFFSGNEDALFMSKYLNKQRSQNDKAEETNKVLKAARQRQGRGGTTKIDTGFSCKICDETDAIQMAEVYRRVFETYPFPIHDSGYIVETMHKNVIYFGVWNQDKIVALSSAEIDAKSSNAEMTDFATLPEYRGKGFSLFLLQMMEAEMRKTEIMTVYTIARALSFGMNITFAKMCYTYSGTLINNTNISGNLESMNVWYKIIKPSIR
jgi:putative beta-lysine N-acetyltransferase